MDTIHAWYSMEAAARVGSAVYRKPSGDKVNVTRMSDDINNRDGRRSDDVYVGEVVRGEDGGCVRETHNAADNH
jgi:hypothetical protein